MRNIIVDMPLTKDALNALRIAMAAKDVNVAGIAATYGKDVSMNDSYMELKQLGGDRFPVCPGAEGPILRDYRWTGFPDGEDVVSDEYAWDLVRRKALEYSGDLEVIALGPVTNIALFIKKYHDVRREIKKITVIGSTGLFGDAAPYSEFNIWADPLAMEIISDSMIPFETIDLDCIGKMRLSYDETIAAAGHPDFLIPKEEINWLDFDCQNFFPVSKSIGMRIWLDPSCCVHARYRARVEVGTGTMRGRVIYYDRADLSEVFNAIKAENVKKEMILSI